MTWNDVTSNYAGLFFRAEGGGSEAFEKIQSENSPRLIGVDSHFLDNYQSRGPIQITPGKYSQWLSTGGSNAASSSINFLVSEGEVRPRNMVIRVWKRTG
jgi:hypothetical protein